MSEVYGRRGRRNRMLRGGGPDREPQAAEDVDGLPRLGRVTA